MGSRISKPISTILRLHQTTQPQQRKHLKMSKDSLSGKAFDYCNDVAAKIDPDQGGRTPPSRGLPIAVPWHGSISSLDLKIIKRHLQLLQWRRAVELKEPKVNSTYSLSEMTDSYGQRLYSRDQKSRRLVALKKQQAQKIRLLHVGRLRKHLVQVDVRGHP